MFGGGGGFGGGGLGGNAGLGGGGGNVGGGGGGRTSSSSETSGETPLVLRILGFAILSVMAAGALMILSILLSVAIEISPLGPMIYDPFTLRHHGLIYYAKFIWLAMVVGIASVVLFRRSKSKAQGQKAA